MDISVTQLNVQKVIRLPLVLAVAMGSLWTGGSELRAQETREITANPDLKAGRAYSLLFGADYRDLWTTPFEIEVLDFSTEAGGLTPEFRVGGNQTFGLALTGADGKSYTFRSLIKGLRTALHPDLQNKKFGDFTQDQLAAVHPAGTVMVPPLAEAAGVLHNTPRFVVLPDDPALGEFREVFAGRIGTLEQYPTPASDSYAGFEGATEIISSEDFVEKWLANREEKVDADALLRARMFDFFLGDWDRHAKNFRWAKLPGKEGLQALPEDRDQAFVSFEGGLIDLVRPFEPRLLRFDKTYPVSFGLVLQGWPTHRWFLAELEKDAWIETAEDMQSRITDEVIEQAVSLMPKPWYDINAEELASTMRARRDRLPQIANRMYHFMSTEIDLQTTDQSDRIDLRDLGQGQIEVSVMSKTAAEPYFTRVVKSSETKSLRVYLREGQDTIVCSGALSRKIRIDVIGHQAEDDLQGCESANLRFTEIEEIERRKTPLRAAPNPFDEISVPDSDNIPPVADRPRDWQKAATPIYQISVDADDGLVLGYGQTFSFFEFGKVPYGQQHAVAGQVSVTRGKFGATYDGIYQFWNPKLQASLAASVSSIDQADFFGFGNGTSDAGSDDNFETGQLLATITPRLTYLASENLTLFSGVGLIYNSTDDDNTLLNELDPLGVGDFGYINIFTGLDFDTRDRSSFNNPGFHIRVQANVSPEVADVDSTFGSVEGEAAGYVSVGSRSLLALRVGGENVSGTFPFQESAFIGGDTNVRGFQDNRFAGDASVFANLELRYQLGRATAYVSEADYGLVVFTDAGRVFSDDIEGIVDDSNEIHTSGGAGISVTALDRTFALSVVVAVSDEETTGVFSGGFSF